MVKTEEDTVAVAEEDPTEVVSLVRLVFVEGLSMAKWQGSP